MAKRGNETVVISRAPTIDRLGDKVPGSVVGSLTSCIVWPRESTEDANRGVIILDGYTVWAPAPIAIEVRATDTVALRGKDWNIEGVPGDFRKNGRKLGLMLMLKRSGL